MGEILFGGGFMQNFKDAPGFIEDILANQPATALFGTLFVSTDTNELFRFNGTTWVAIGGGAVTPTWQETLIAGSVLSQSNTIDGGAFDFTMQNLNSFNIADAWGEIIELDQTGIYFDDNAGNSIIMETDFPGHVSPLVNLSSAGTMRLLTARAELFMAKSGMSFLATDGGLLIQESTNNIELDCSSGGGGVEVRSGASSVLLTQTTSSSFVEMFPDGHIEIDSPSADVIITSGAQFVILDGSAGVNIGSGGGNVTLSSPGGIIDMANHVQADAGITINTGQVITYNTSAVAPGTSVVVLPTTIYGGGAALMGAPTYWIDCIVAGNPGKIPIYT